MTHTHTHTHTHITFFKSYFIQMKTELDRKSYNECVYVDMVIPVMRLILVLIILGIWCLHGTQRNLVIHIPVYMINTSIPVTDFCILPI